MAFEQQQTAQGMGEDELAEFQKASNEYQPETTVRVVDFELRSGAKANRKRRSLVVKKEKMEADCDFD